MEILIKVLIGLLALLHVYILWFEMFDWQKTGRRVFGKGKSKDFFEQSKAMAANQGLYNGFLAAGLIWSLIIADPIWAKNVALFFTGCILVAGLYGAATASKKILYVQAVPASIIILLLLFS